MILHALVDELATARAAVGGGATVLQLRIKGLSTRELVERGRPFRELAQHNEIGFVVNDDVQAALELCADAVHLGRGDLGAAEAVRAGLPLGLSVSSLAEALALDEREPHYLGVGPVWATPTKPDAGRPLGLDGLQEICVAVTAPVVAIGGIDAGNAAACLEAGASGVAVVRAAAGTAAIRAALDRAPV